MKKITDERLILKNLKQIRVLFAIQMVGILGILGYDLITRGFSEMTDRPLWFLLVITGIIAAYQSATVSVEQEKKNITPNKGFIITLIIISLLVIISGVLNSVIDGLSWMNAVIMPGILFICCIIPAYYVFRLRKKRDDELDDD